MRAVCSFESALSRFPQRASSSSMKIIEGLCSRAISNNVLTSLFAPALSSKKRSSRKYEAIKIGTHLSLSPYHLDITSLLLILNRVDSTSVATAFAR
jgi:hypothetical protein